MSLTTGTVTRTNDIQYGASALVSGISVSATLTRDYDIYMPYTSIAVTTTARTFYTPSTQTGGNIYVITFDGTYYCYQQFAFDYSFAPWEQTTQKLVSNARAKTCTVTYAGGVHKIAISSGTGTAKIRLSVQKS